MADPCRFVLGRMSSFIVGGLLICGALLAAGRFGSTYASYSDLHVMSGNSAGAGVWNPDPAPFAVAVECAGLLASGRSGEQTSELPTLMSISHTVFCLKLKHMTTSTKQNTTTESAK